MSVLAEITTRQSSAMGVPPRVLLSRGVQSTSLPNRVAVAASPSAQYGNMYCGEGGLNVFTHAVHVIRITGVDHGAFKDDRDCNRFAQSRLLQFGTSPTCVQGTLFSAHHVQTHFVSPLRLHDVGMDESSLHRPQKINNCCQIPSPSGAGLQCFERISPS